MTVSSLLLLLLLLPLSSLFWLLLSFQSAPDLELGHHVKTKSARLFIFIAIEGVCTVTLIQCEGRQSAGTQPKGEQSKGPQCEGRCCSSCMRLLTQHHGVLAIACHPLTVQQGCCITPSTSHIPHLSYLGQLHLHQLILPASKAGHLLGVAARHQHY